MCFILSVGLHYQNSDLKNAMLHYKKITPSVIYLPWLSLLHGRDQQAVNFQIDSQAFCRVLGLALVFERAGENAVLAVH
jgi:hypothetical protein